jgi:hypothetical protein
LSPFSPGSALCNPHQLNFPLLFTTNLQAHGGLPWISTCYCSPPVANATPLAHVCTAVAFAVALRLLSATVFGRMLFAKMPESRKHYIAASGGKGCAASDGCRCVCPTCQLAKPGSIPMLQLISLGGLCSGTNTPSRHKVYIRRPCINSSVCLQ